ncbi:MAG: GNAT family N-acetyltransferase [Pyrinomonadaceae bacterium]
MIEIVQAETAEQIGQAQNLFREYETWFGLKLCFQNFDEELKNLPGKYAPPDGRLFLAFADKKLAGCIALRKLEDKICEMKRLFVREDFRGFRSGKILIEKLIAEAQTIGYEKMRLDTFPSKMGKAVELYNSYGFYEIKPYYYNPYGETLFMELDFKNKNALTAEEGGSQSVY